MCPDLFELVRERDLLTSLLIFAVGLFCRSGLDGESDELDLGNLLTLLVGVAVGLHIAGSDDGSTLLEEVERDFHLAGAVLVEHHDVEEQRRVVLAEVVGEGEASVALAFVGDCISGETS